VFARLVINTNQVLLKNILKVDREKAAANELYKSGDFAAALDAYGAAIEIDKLNAAVNSTLHCNRANCYVKLGNWEEAAAEAGAAIDRNEAYSKAFALRGQARVQLNNYEDACADYERASELSPDSAEFKTALNEVRAAVESRSLVLSTHSVTIPSSFNLL
jgi:tetratricopeptide (TPR) repeat protein